MFLLTCRPKRYQYEPTTWPKNIKVRRPIVKYAPPDANMNGIGDWPIKSEQYLYNFGMYCK